MSRSKNISVQSSSAIGFPGLLTILFIGLKLSHVIDWSWLWVLSPLWMPAAIFLGLFAIFLFFWLLIYLSLQTVVLFVNTWEYVTRKKRK